MQTKKPVKARRQSDAEIEAHVKRFHLKEDFDLYREKLMTLLNEATEDSQEALAGFMFAYSSVSNEIARRNNVR